MNKLPMAYVNGYERGFQKMLSVPVTNFTMGYKMIDGESVLMCKSDAASIPHMFVFPDKSVDGWNSDWV